MTATPTQTRSQGSVDSPVDDATYNVLMALASKLEAIDTYRKYANDGSGSDLWAQLAADDRRHADRLLEELKSRLTTNR
jgi:rubrerythrin